MSDLTNGTRHLPVDEIVRVGPDVLYVRPETAQQLEAQQGGLTGAVSDAGDRAKGAASKASAKASGVRDQASDAAAEASPEDRLIGQRSGRDVEDDTGAVLVANGQRISAADVDRAKAAGKLPELTAAVGFAQVGTAGAAAGDALGDVGDKATELWDKFTAKLGQVTDATGQRVDEQQTKQRLGAIEDAVGRPVTKVILDLDDDVILDLGISSPTLPSSGRMTPERWTRCSAPSTRPRCRSRRRSFELESRAPPRSMRVPLAGPPSWTSSARKWRRPSASVRRRTRRSERRTRPIERVARRSATSDGNNGRRARPSAIRMPTSRPSWRRSGPASPRRRRRTARAGRRQSADAGYPATPARARGPEADSASRSGGPRRARPKRAPAADAGV